MIEFTKQWVINIVALVLFIVMFEMLLPTGKLKKYINLVTGTILIIAIISPLTGFFGRNTDLTALQVTNSSVLDKLQVEKESKILEEEQMKQIVGVYRDKIIEQLEQNAEEIKGVKQAYADVIFNEDYSSRNFGEIKRAYIEIIPESGSTSDGKGDISSQSTGADATIGDFTATDSASGENPAADSTVTDSTAAVATTGDSIATDSSKQAAISVDSVNGDNFIKPVDRVKKVNIGKETRTGNIADNIDPIIKRKLEERISGVFGISSDSIIISLVNDSRK